MHTRKPSQREFTGLKPEPKIKRRQNLTGEQFLELCAEQEIQLVKIHGFGTGPGNGEWWADVSEVKHEHRAIDDTGHTGETTTNTTEKQPINAPVEMQEIGTTSGLQRQTLA